MRQSRSSWTVGTSPGNRRRYPEGAGDGDPPRPLNTESVWTMFGHEVDGALLTEIDAIAHNVFATLRAADPESEARVRRVRHARHHLLSGGYPLALKIQRAAVGASAFR